MEPFRDEGRATIKAVDGDSVVTNSFVTRSILGSPDGTLIGYHDPQWFHLLPSATYNIVAKFTRNEGRFFAPKERALWRELAGEGILEMGEVDHYAVKVRINGESRKFPRLRRSAVEKIWGLC